MIVIEISKALPLNVISVFLQMVDKVESALLLMESRMSAKLDRIEERLDILETSSTQPAPISSTFTLVRIDFYFALSNLTVTLYFLVMFKDTREWMAHKYRENIKTFDYLKLEKQQW